MSSEPDIREVVAETVQAQTQSQDQTTKHVAPPLHVVLGLPGSTFSFRFLLSWTAALNTLWESGRYKITVSPGPGHSFVPFARQQTLGLDVLRGASQKPFDGMDYDVFVTIDSDVVFSAEQIIELIETCAQMHPVVCGGYHMANGKELAIVREWDTAHFTKEGRFPFLTREAVDAWKAEQKAAVASESEAKPNVFMPVAYAGMGFFACRRDVLDSLSYPYFWAPLERLRNAEGKLIVEQVSEDVAFCKALTTAGWTVQYHTGIHVGHEKIMVV